MQSAFLSLAVDFAFVSLFGSLGGLVLALLQGKGLEMPHLIEASGTTFVDAGFLADIIIGAAAAAVTYAVNPPAGKVQLFATTFTAGIGGSGILKAYIKGTATREHADQAERYRAAANDAASGHNIDQRLTDLRLRDEQLRRRFGPR